MQTHFDKSLESVNTDVLSKNILLRTTLRAFLISSLCCASVLSGCHIDGSIHNATTPIDSSELNIKHVYKIPKKLKKTWNLERFDDAQLAQLIAVSLHDAPDIRSARSRLIQSKHVAQGAYASLWPSADLQGYVEKQYFSFNGTVPETFKQINVSQLSIGDLAINFNYELDFWGKNRALFASKLSEQFAAAMELQQTRIVISSAVASAYVNTQANIAQKQLARDNLSIQQELEHIIIDRAKQGIESDIPVKTAIISTQTARIDNDNIKLSEQLSRSQLAVLMGKNPFNTQIEIPVFKYNASQLKLPSIIPANLLAQRPDIAASRALVESAAQQIHVARTAFFPNINLSGILSMQSLYFSRFLNVNLKTGAIKSALELPLFDAGARRANLGSKYAQYDIAVNQYNQTILNALQEVKNRLSTIRTLDVQIVNESKALRSTAANYHLFSARYKQGVIDYVQLLEIKQTLIQQKIVLLNLQNKQKLAYIALLAALGGEISL